MGEQVTVGDADTERIEAPSRAPTVIWVKGVAAERLRQRRIDKGDIGTVLTEDYIPRLLTR